MTASREGTSPAGVNPSSVVIVFKQVFVSALEVGFVYNVAFTGIHVPVQVFCPLVRFRLWDLLISRDHNALAGFDIDILKSARPGDALVAEALAVHQGGRSGLYDVKVMRGDELVAVFRGRSARLKDRWVVPELEV